MVINLTSFLLKTIGIISMAFDHAGISILGNFSFFNLIGRLAFPLFAFQSTEGYIHTKNFKKHIMKLLLFACISQIPFMLFLSTFSNDIFSLNVLFTFVLGLLAIYLYDKSSNKFLGFLFVLILGIIAQFLKTDYGIYGIFLMFIFYVLKNKKALMLLSSTILMILFYGSYIIRFPNVKVIYFLYMIFSCLSLFFIGFYNTKEGPKAKYLFYIFYPLHLIILYFISKF